jgi:hypothetical protein
VFALHGLQSPAVAEDGDTLAVAAGEDLGLPFGGQPGGPLRGGTSGEGVVEAFQGDGAVEFLVHPVGRDLELQGAHGGQDGCLVTA